MGQTKAQTHSRRAREDAKLAAALATFNLNYGQDETKLEMWQQLCEDCGLERARSISKCKALLRAVAVNIWDLIQARKIGELPVKKYKTKMELRLDLRHPSRRFPLKRVKHGDENKLLRALLVTIA